jgi:hypothetical protein
MTPPRWRCSQTCSAAGAIRAESSCSCNSSASEWWAEEWRPAATLEEQVGELHLSVDAGLLSDVRDLLDSVQAYSAYSHV